MKASDLSGDAATLDTCLTNPQKVVPRNNCHFRGVKTSANAAPSSPCSPLLRSRVGRRRLPNRPKVLKRLRLHDGTGAIDRAAAIPGPNYVAGQRYTLRSKIAEGRMVFIGVGGSTRERSIRFLAAAESQVVHVTLINGEGYRA